MCCGDSVLCPAVPDIDWSAFTWRWQSPDAATEWQYNGQIDGSTKLIGRKIYATNREMVHPGVCNCLWMVSISDKGRDTTDPNGIPSSVPCLGSLQRNGQTWLLTIVRWYFYDWRYVNNALLGWDDSMISGSCNAINGGAAGWSPFGWNGWGWGYGWVYGWYAYENSYGNRAEYTLTGDKLLTDGSANRFDLRTLVSNGDDAGDTADKSYWPAFVNLSTIPKDGRQT